MAFFQRHLISEADTDNGAGVVKPRPYEELCSTAGVGARLVRAREYLRLPSLLLAVLVCMFFSPAGRAQPAPKPPPTFRTLALGSAVSGISYEYRSKIVPVIAAGSDFSAPYTSPDNGHLVLFREIPAEKPDEKPTRVILADVQVGEGPWLVFLIARSETPDAIQALAVEDSWAQHPVETVRLFNFSSRKAAVKLGQTVAELDVTHSQLFPYEPAKKIRLQAAFSEGGKWVLRVGGPQLILPRTRSTMVLLDQPASEDLPFTREVLVRNFIDSEPVPPAP